MLVPAPFFDLPFLISCLLRQPDQIIHSLDESMHRHITNTTMQMQSQLPVQSFEADIQSVVLATLLQECKVKLIMLPAEHLPCHFDIAVGRNIDRRRRRLLF